MQESSGMKWVKGAQNGDQQTKAHCSLSSEWEGQCTVARERRKISSRDIWRGDTKTQCGKLDDGGDMTEARKLGGEVVWEQRKRGLGELTCLRTFNALLHCGYV